MNELTLQMFFDFCLANNLLYLAKDSDNELFGYSVRPIKGQGIWYTNTDVRTCNLNAFKDFDFLDCVKWENESATFIKNL